MPTYVKFAKGTPTAFNNLETKDSSTLYFISEAGATKGTLYLGDIVIGGSMDVSIDDLRDVLSEINLSDIGGISSTIPEDGQILGYDSTSETWGPVDLSGPSVFEGAAAGLVPAYESEDENVITKFLNNKGEWVAIDIDSDAMNGVLDNLEKILYGDEETSGLLKDVDNISEKIQSLEELDVVQFNTRVENLEDAIKALKDDDDKYIFALQSEVGNLSNLFTESTIVGALNELDSRLTWDDLTE